MRPENLYPKLSLNIAVRNEGKRIATLLNSIVNQTYPESCLEILIVDGLSSDNTLEIVKRYSKDFDIPVRIIDNPKMDCPTGRKLGLLNATGDLHLYLDADMELAETTTLEKLVKPLIKYPDVVGSFTRLLASPDDPPLNRFLSYNPFQHDPLFEFLSNNVENTVCEKCEEGYKCIFSFGSVPVVGVILCKTNILKKVYEQIIEKWPDWVWSDVDIPIAMTRAGYNKFIYVTNTGIYHHGYMNLSTLFNKKRRDLTRTYLTTYKKRYSTYVDFNSKKDLLKLIMFILYSESLFLPIMRGVYKAIKFRDFYCILYEPTLSWGLTNYIISLLILDKHGRKFIYEFVKKLVR